MEAYNSVLATADLEVYEQGTFLRKVIFQTLIQDQRERIGMASDPNVMNNSPKRPGDVIDIEKVGDNEADKTRKVMQVALGTVRCGQDRSDFREHGLDWAFWVQA
ncbi:hypothetical protein MJO28_002094 [Puccinia striiformis f. sp. tritici]|uniref:Uncharacterized protein n=1 Tax=Puccinia striiformis f. sp. tritici TaxID=168172 RepID=A0ACC0EVE0_9BASI|nr:hypothetical protein MJO28_002094 [Puccinia striiformis f. sp. tritici]KAI7966420.1 hypothetical protein MJO29_002168 [Puccinia striiformis f. sp. tritici]